MIYLACPYSSPDRHVRVERFEIANTIAARLMGQGIHVFSPISHTHPIAEAGSLPKDWNFWKEYDLKFMQIVTKLIVIKLEGWEDSIGVQAEIEHAKSMGIPIEYIKMV